MNIPPGTKGALKELAVATKLMTLGYQVFLNVAPHGIDMIVMDTEGVLSKVEVKSLQFKGETGTGYCAVHATQRGTFDTLIAVTDDLEMHAHPHIPHFKPLYPTQTEGNYTTVPS